MYKILIADDEKWIRAGLIKTVDWENYGFGEILEASDGRSALDLAVSEKPDAIIADIKMPGMTGIEMTEQLRRLGSDVYVILISGFGEFVYAQRAIECGVREYILKPVEKSRIEEAMLKCREYLDEKAGEGADNKKDKINRYLSIAQSHLLREILISDTRVLSESQRQAMADLGLGGPDRKLIISVIRFSPEKITAEDVTPLIEDNLSNDNYCVFPGKSSNELCILFDAADEAELVSSASGLVENINAGDMGLICSYGTAESEEKIWDSYDNAIKFCDYRFFIPGHRQNRDKSLLPETKYNLPSYTRLLNLILSENYEAALNHINQCFSALPQQVNQDNAANVRRLLLEKLERVFGECMARGLFTKDDPPYLKLRELPEQLSLTDTRTLLTAMISDLENRNGSQRSSSGQLAQSAIAYVKEHYRENISMNAVAKYLCVNPSYFSHVFSEQVKIPFTKYLNYYRVTVAKQLLTDPAIKIYEVAHLVGFDDYRYFSKLFKELEGISPDQYRNLLTED